MDSFAYRVYLRTSDIHPDIRFIDSCLIYKYYFKNMSILF